MTCLEFIASLANSLAWPGVVLLALVLLKGPLIRGLPHLQKLKYKELEAEFGRELDKVEEDAKAAGLDTPEDTEVVEDFEENLRHISDISPNAAIVEAFRMIERSAKELIKSKGSTPDYKVGAPYRLIERILEETHILSRREIKIFRDLRQLRNKITHSELVASTQQAHEYIELAALLIGKFEEVAEKR